MMKIKYEIRIYWSNEDNSYIAEIPELEACIADGKTPEKALEMLEEVYEIWMSSAKKHKALIPKPNEIKRKLEVA
ncbi:MAG: type II toxin-antitoxin system HicB family antitoxin [Ignavibacteria bacterium]